LKIFLKFLDNDYLWFSIIVITFCRQSKFQKFFQKNSANRMFRNFSAARFFSCWVAFFTTALIIFNAEVKAQEAALELPKVTVIANDAKDGEVDGYKTGLTRSSTRSEMPLLDVPQAVSVVTQDQIRDQNISNIGEAVRYVPGVALHQGENNRDQVIMRGNSTSADFFIDGARDDVQYFRDFYNIDRIEVLKGPNAMAFGRGGSGGVINRVSKIADGKKTRQAIISGGSFDNGRVQADIGDKVNEVLSLRLNSVYEKSGTFRQYGDLERYGFNPTATLNLAKNTNLKFGYEYFYDSRFNDRGIPSQNGAAYTVNASTFFGNPTQNKSDATVQSSFAILNHNFSPTLKLRNYTRYTDNSKFYQNAYAGSSVNSAGNLSIVAYNNQVKRQNFTNQTDITKNFDLGSFNHTALIGAEIARQNSQAFRNTGYFNNSTTSVLVPANNPLTFAPITYRQSATDANNNSQVDIYAGYVQDQIEISKKLQLTAGLRYDIFKMTLRDKGTNLDYGQTNHLLSPRAGLVFKPQESLSIYSSYSVSYLPSSGDQFSTLNAQVKSLKPEHLQNYEIGTKWNATSKLNLSLAFYQLDRTNTRANDPSGSGNFVLTGASRTRGVEFGATGKINNQWQIITAYAFQNAVITKQTTSAASGANVALVPKHMASLWNKYDFNQKLAAGIGTIYQSDQFAAVDNAVKLKGFTRFDVAAYYKITKAHRLQINVENVLGRKYIQTADGNNNLQPGSPRAFKVSLVADF
jgi:catecholate siderophore receptor